MPWRSRARFSPPRLDRLRRNRFRDHASRLARSHRPLRSRRGLPRKRTCQRFPRHQPKPHSGCPIYPGAAFLTSYDAGRSQRYYLFGTNATFDEIVNYYKVVLDTRGDLVFEAPATHMFEVGRFREGTMAFPPGVTVKDYTWNGSEGYLNPHAGVEPARFRTVVQIVPPPSGAPAR